MFSNANSFKARIKNMAKDRGIPAQQLQQNFLIEQVLKLIAKSSYKDFFIVKGGYLIGQLIGWISVNILDTFWEKHLKTSALRLLDSFLVMVKNFTVTKKECH